MYLLSHVLRWPGAQVVLLATLTLISATTLAASGDYVQGLSAFQRAFAEGRMNDGAKHAPELISSLRAAKYVDRIGALRRIHDECVASYQFGCEQEAFGELTVALRELDNAHDVTDDLKRLLIADFAERGTRRSLLYGWTNQLGDSMPLLERTLATWAGALDFARSNLTLAEAYLMLRNLERAVFYSRRGWYFFLSNQGVAAEDFQTLLSEFLEVFISTGQSRRAVTAMALFRGLAFNMRDARPYLQFRLRSADFLIDNALDYAGGIAQAGRASLSMLKALQFPPNVSDYLELRLLAATIAGCLVSNDSGCQIVADTDRAAQLLTKLTGNDAGEPTWPWAQAAAAVLALHSVAIGPVPPPIVDGVLNSPRTAGADAAPDESNSTTLMGRALLQARTDKVAARLLLEQGARKMLEERRLLEAINPLESAPLPMDERLGVQLVLSSLAKDLDSLSEEERSLLFELCALSHRNWRTIEAKYLYASAAIRDDDQRASLQAYHRLEQEISRQEREAIKDLREIANGKKVVDPKSVVDFQRFRRFNELDRLQRLHSTAASAASATYNNRSSLLDDVRKALQPGERFVTHAVAFGKLIRVCFDKEGFHASFSERDPQRDLIAIKTLLAALTNPAPSGSAIDRAFPLAEAKYLTSLTLGDDSRCVAQAETLIAAPDPVFFWLPLHVLLDPARAATISSSDALATIPWLGASRGLSIVTDPRQFIASRAMASTSVAPLAFLGVGDPVLSGKTIDGSSQSELALRGVKRGGVSVLAELEELPQTKRELERMASAFGPSSRLLLRGSASEINVRRQVLSDFRVLSFATHGLVREEIDGLAEPALVLTPRDSKTTFNDGLLTATEISELPLRADLVILSACNSASFDVATFAYQAAGLSTAFFMAGARSTLASLWSVDSESTAQLMELLANEVASDSSVGSSLALRRAIQRFLSREESKSYRHPRFWAAFLVFGDGGRLPLKRGNVRTALTPIDSSDGVVWGAWDRSQGTKAGWRLESGHQDTGKSRVRGTLRRVNDGRPAWEVGDDNFSFILPAGHKLKRPSVLAWNVQGDVLRLELRTYLPNGRLLSRREIEAHGDNRVGGFLSLANGRFIAATYRDNGPTVGYRVTLHLLDSDGRLVTSRGIPLPAGLRISSISLFPSHRGVWVTATGEERREKYEQRLLPMGAEQPCIWRNRSHLILIKPDLSLAGDERSLIDTLVWRVNPAAPDADVAAISVYDSCFAQAQFSSGVAFLRAGREPQVFIGNLKGANSSGVVAFAQPRGEWLLISSVRRELDAWKKLDFNYWSAQQDPENAARGFMTSQQTGLLVTRFDAQGRVVASSLHLIPGELWTSDAYLKSDGELIVLGANNGARFVGQLSIP